MRGKRAPLRGPFPIPPFREMRSASGTERFLVPPAVRTPAEPILEYLFETFKPWNFLSRNFQGLELFGQKLPRFGTFAAGSSNAWNFVVNTPEAGKGVKISGLVSGHRAAGLLRQMQLQ